MKFSYQFDENYKGSFDSKGGGESKTQPDMTLSIKELLLNHTRGLTDPSIVKEGIYLGDEEVPIFKDLTEMYEAREKLMAQKLEIEEAIKAEEEKAKAENDKKIEEAIKAEEDQ